MRLLISSSIRAAAILLLISSATLANPIGAHWALIDTTAPARYGFAAVYNTLENNIVLFGGIDTSGQMPQDTWEWNGTSWQQVATTGPVGRAGFGMCYVGWEGFVLLYGGRSSSGGYLGDTWLWDGVEWTEVTIPGPPARADFAMTYDQSSENVILFGGANDQSLFGDTWQWDGSQWSLVDTTGPAARIYSRITSVPDYNACILFGGLAGYDGETLDDSWAWISSSWVQMEGENPSPRLGHMMAYNPTWGLNWSVELFGGQDAPDPSQYYDDTWELDDYGWYLTQTGEPPARSFSEMVYHEGLEKVIVIAGMDSTQIFHDMWVYPVFDSPSCNYHVGDANGNGAFNGLDVTYSVSYFKGGTPPPYSCVCGAHGAFYVAGDVNNSCSFNGLDVTYMVAYFKGGPTPYPCADCPPSL